MAFITMHLSGAEYAHDSIDAGQFELLLDELALADDEHPDVAVSYEDGWTLSAFRNGRLIWGNVEDEAGSDRHMEAVPRAEMLRLFEALAVGDIAAVERQAWQPGQFESALGHRS